MGKPFFIIYFGPKYDSISYKNQTNSFSACSETLVSKDFVSEIIFHWFVLSFEFNYPSVRH